MQQRAGRRVAGYLRQLQPNAQKCNDAERMFGMRPDRRCAIRRLFDSDQLETRRFDPRTSMSVRQGRGSGGYGLRQTQNTRESGLIMNGLPLPNTVNVGRRLTSNRRATVGSQQSGATRRSTAYVAGQVAPQDGMRVPSTLVGFSSYHRTVGLGLQEIAHRGISTHAVAALSDRSRGPRDRPWISMELTFSAPQHGSLVYQPGSGVPCIWCPRCMTARTLLRPTHEQYAVGTMPLSRSTKRRAWFTFAAERSAIQ